MSIIKAIWAAIMAFFSSRKRDQQAAQQAAQENQNQIVEETQHEVDEVPGKTDDELASTAESLGLVQSKNSSRTFRPGDGTGPGCGYHSGSKASRKAEK